MFNNYYAFAMPKDEKFNSVVNRYDWVINQDMRFNFRWQWNDRLADEYDWTYETVRGLHSNGLTRINRGGNIGYLWTLSASHILDLNFGISRWEEGSRNQTRTKVKAADTGLPAYIDQRADRFTQLPRIDFNNITDIGDSYPVIGTLLTNGELRASMTSIRGNHTFKYGWQERRHYFAGAGPGSSTGIYQFRNNWTRATNVDNQASNHVHDWAAFLMGMPNSLSIDYNDTFYWRTPRRALYFQDDWRVTTKLRLSLGLRYEREGGTDEKLNRGLSWVLLDQKSPISSLVEAAYAANPIPEVAASQFRVSGIPTFFGQEGYKYATQGTHVLLPKFGLVYSLNNKTVIRGGWGMYQDTLNVSNDRPYTDGYSQPTTTPITNDAGLTFCCGVGSAAGIAQGRTIMNDPFPVRPEVNNTRFNEPFRTALQGVARFGTDFNSRPWGYKPALQHRWRIGFQREILANTMVDFSYNGAYSYIPVTRRLNALPEQYWTKGMVRDQANDNYLNANLANPFNIKYLAPIQQSNPELYKYLAGTGFFTSGNLQRNRFLRPYPQFTTLNTVGDRENSRQGFVTYHDMQLLVDRRMTRGLQATFMYTWASSYVADYYYNEFDAFPSERVSNNIRPHRIALSAVYQLPFGKGRDLVKEGFVSYLIGNWNLSGVWQVQSGPALDWSNRFFYGDLKQLKALMKSEETRSKDMLQWFDGSIAWRGSTAPPADFVGFEGRTAAQPGSYHVRMFPYRTDAVRADGIKNLDLKIERLFPIKQERGVQARFSVDLLNATNHTNLSAPSTDPTSAAFGRVTSQRGLSRVIQFNLRVEF
jgi:hypothetical protein